MVGFKFPNYPADQLVTHGKQATGENKTVDIQQHIYIKDPNGQIMHHLVQCANCEGIP